MNKIFLPSFIKNIFSKKRENNKKEFHNARVEQNNFSTSEISFNLHNQRVDDVAIPKADIVATSDKTSLSELTDIFKRSNLTDKQLEEYSTYADNSTKH